MKTREVSSQAWIFIAIVALVSGACGSTKSHESARASAGNTDLATSVESRLFDDDARSDLIETYWPSVYDFRDLANRVDVVFVATIAGFAEDVYRDTGNIEDELAGLTEEERSAVDATPPWEIVYDGISLDVQEVLAGDAKVGERLVVAHPAAYRADLSAEALPITEPPIEVLAPAAAELSEGLITKRRFVVFANATSDKSGLVTFFGPGSIAEVDAKDRVLETGHPPFVYLRAENSADGWDLDLDLLRNWIVEGPPPSEIPVDAWPTDRDAPPTTDR